MANFLRTPSSSLLNSINSVREATANAANSAINSNTATSSTPRLRPSQNFIPNNIVTTNNNGVIPGVTPSGVPIAEGSNNLFTANNNLSNLDISGQVANLTANINDFDPTAYTNRALAGIDAVNTDVSSRVSDMSALRGENETLNTFRQTLSDLEQGAREGFQVDRNIADRTLAQFDASTQAANLANAQRMAANPNISQGARNAFRMESLMTLASQRSQLAGDLAIKAQERSYDALKKLSEMSLEGAKFDEQMLQNDIGNVFKEIDNELATAFKKGEITMQEAELEFQKQAKIVDTAIDGLKMELTKRAELASNELEKVRIESEVKALEAANLDVYETRAKGIILDNKTYTVTNPDGTETLKYRTADEMAADPVVVTAVNTVYNQMFGREMDLTDPVDKTWFDGYVRSVRTPTQADIENAREKLQLLDLPPDLTEEILKTTLSSSILGGISVLDDGTYTLKSPDGTTVFSYKYNETTGNWDAVDTTPVSDTTEDATAEEGTISLSSSGKVQVTNSLGDVENYNFTPGVYDETALSVLTSFPDSFQGQQIIDSLADDISSNFYNIPSNFDYDELPEETQQAIATRLDGLVSEVNTTSEFSQSDDLYEITQFKSASKGDVFKYNGSYIVYTGNSSRVNNAESATRDAQKYSFYDIATGEPIEIQAGRRGDNDTQLDNIQTTTEVARTVLGDPVGATKLLIRGIRRLFRR